MTSIPPVESLPVRNPPSESGPNPISTREQLTMHLVGMLNRGNFPYLYLRGYQNLPGDIGNDVDLLVSPGQRARAAGILAHAAKEAGWRLFRKIEFGPLSLYFINSAGDSFLHVDLFDRIEWHWIPFADTKALFARKAWNGLVFHPSPHDEVFLNVMTRLGYAGIVREKHRLEARDLIARGGGEPLIETWAAHLGSRSGISIGDKVSRLEWDSLLSMTRGERLHLYLRLILKRPASSIFGLVRYLKRSVLRLLQLPGPFIVFEGADGVGKSTVIQSIPPLLKGITGREDFLLFHWKPCKNSIQTPDAPASPPRDPRLSPPRSFFPSLAFLTYHWLGFWAGWFRFVLPSRIKNRATIADRYAWEFYLDPKRLRLKLPPWILKSFAMATPPPTLTIGLIAAPQRIKSRKDELPLDDIIAYQERMRELSGKQPRWVNIDASADAPAVCTKVKSAVVGHACPRL